MPPPQAAAPLLDVRGLSRGYSNGRGDAPLRGVFDVSFAMEPGERIAIIGPNGAGKTTLLRLLAGTLRAEKGVIAAYPLRRRYLPAREGFYDDLAVLANLAYFREALHEEGPVPELSVPGEAPAGRLSSGERRRLALRWHFSDPADLYLLDEPTTNLDEAASGEVIAEIREKALPDSGGPGAGVLFTSHDKDFLRRARKEGGLTRVISIVEGRLRYDGAPEGILE